MRIFDMVCPRLLNPHDYFHCWICNSKNCKDSGIQDCAIASPELGTAAQLIEPLEMMNSCLRGTLPTTLARAFRGTPCGVPAQRKVASGYKLKAEQEATKATASVGRNLLMAVDYSKVRVFCSGHRGTGIETCRTRARPLWAHGITLAHVAVLHTCAF